MEEGPTTVELPAVLALIVPLVIGGIVHAVVIRRDLFARLAVPIDGGVTFHGRPLLGPNKTVRGMVVMPLATALASIIAFAAVPPVAPPPPIGWAGLGAAMGLAYVLAELPNSFIKRRLGVSAGGRAERFPALQYFADQADSVIGVVLAVWVILGVTATDLLILVAVGIVVHVMFDLGLHAVGVKPAVMPAKRPKDQTM